VFVAGATGVLGRRLVRQLAARGHAVAGLVRDDRGRGIVTTLGGEARPADLFDVDSLARAAAGAEVVIHAATAIPKAGPRPAGAWAMNDRIRREGTRALAAAAGRVGATVYLQQSIVWIARPADHAFFDETAPPNPEPAHHSALDGERIAQEAGARDGFAVAVLRCGWFYGADADSTVALARGLRAGRLPIVGAGDAVWALLHADDAASAFVATAEVSASGIFHVVDDCPVTARVFLTEFADRLGVRRPRRVPVWLARVIAGRPTVGFMAASTRTSNDRFRRAVGWTPGYPTYREGLDEIVRCWNENDSSVTGGGRR
jgi:nucleoside-diphosphate-sugar epimerase